VTIYELRRLPSNDDALDLRPFPNTGTLLDGGKLLQLRVGVISNVPDHLNQAKVTDQYAARSRAF
jgi:hypothetical protein